MSKPLQDPYRHNTWATQQLLAFCKDLTAEQLQATAEGTYGSILSTLQHILGAENRYRFRLTGEEPFEPRPEEIEDIAELQGIAEQLAASWEKFTSGEIDTERGITVTNPEGGALEVKAGVIVAQVLNHGNEHRAQIYTILTTLGIEPPDLDGWSYGQATGRFVPKSS